MKRLVLSLLMLIGIISVADAQLVCKISGSNDNVEIFDVHLDDSNHATVTVSNDSQDISANVTVTVEVSYNRGQFKQEYSSKGLAKPNQTTRITINIEDYRGFKAEKVKAVSISGTKCL